MAIIDDVKVQQWIIQRLNTMGEEPRVIVYGQGTGSASTPEGGTDPLLAVIRVAGFSVTPQPAVNESDSDHGAWTATLEMLVPAVGGGPGGGDCEYDKPFRIAGEVVRALHRKGGTIGSGDFLHQIQCHQVSREYVDPVSIGGGEDDDDVVVTFQCAGSILRNVGVGSDFDP